MSTQAENIIVLNYKTTNLENSAEKSDKRDAVEISMTPEDYAAKNSSIGKTYSSVLSTSTAYSHGSFTPKVGSTYHIKTLTSASSAYNFYIHVVDENDKIIEQHLPTSFAQDFVEYDLTVNNPLASKVYVNCYGEKSLFPYRVKVTTEGTISLQQQIDKLSGDIESYVEKLGCPMLDKALKKVVSLNKRNKYLNFAFITDTHHRPTDDEYYRNSMNNMKLFKVCGDENVVDFCAHGGDIISAYGYSPDEAVVAFGDSLRTIRPMKSPLYIVKGNHDNNGSQDKDSSLYLTDVQTALLINNNMDDVVCEKVVNGVSYGDGKIGYYYRDFEKQKIRVIFLNKYCVDPETKSIGDIDFARQYQWFCMAALDMPDDYKVIVIVHPATSEASRFADILKAFNDSVSISSQFISGYPYSNDWTGKPSKRVIAWIHGHAHQDMYNNDYGFNDIGVIEGYTNDESLVNTDKEYKFDVFTVDTDNNVLYETRVGEQWKEKDNPSRGTDRSWSFGTTSAPLT